MLSKKKLFNLVELAIQTLFLISTFAIQSVTMGSHSYNSTSISKMSIVAYSVLSANSFGFIAVGLMLLTIILCLVSIFGNSTDKDGKLHVAIPITNLFFGGWILSVSAAPSGFDTLSVNPVYKVFGFVCLLAVVVLSIIKRTSYVVPKEEKQPQIINNIQEKSSADELKKFKDLLDSGIITQEEFDEKKKQLLGL